MSLARQSGRAGPYEKEYLRKDGSRTWMLITAASLGDGTLIEYCIDITDRKQAQAQAADTRLYAETVFETLHEPLLVLASDLTVKSADRKRGEEELRLANKALLGLNADLKHFSYAVSHDMQEPLRMVISYTELLERDYGPRLDDEARRYIRVAVNGASRMEALLNDLREYWSVNEKKVEHLIAVDTTEVLQTALRQLNRVVEEAGAVITNDPLPVIQAEPHPLLALFLNLISNGLKYRRQGAVPKIHVSAQRADRGWEFAIADNGIGIPADSLDSAFLPFRRLHGAEFPGTGLGLAMCRKVVERYGGKIWAESNTGTGSIFRFALPR